MATSGSCKYTHIESNSGFKLEFVLEWHEGSRNKETLTTAVNWNLYLYLSKTGTYYPNGRFDARDIKIVFDGTTTTLPDISTTISSDTTGFLMGSGTTNIKHNSNGLKDFTYSFNIGRLPAYASSMINNTLTNIGANGTASLDPYVFGATLVSAPNFTDEENPTITYSNPSGPNVTSLQAAISFTGSTDDIKYRDIPKGAVGSTSLTYTFNFTTAEKNTLYSKLNEGAYTTSVRFYIKSVADGVTTWDYVTRTLTFVNYKPTLSPTVYDTNSATIALTGNRNKLIRYMSNAYFSMNAQARKGATIDTQFARNGDTTITDKQTGTFNGVTSNTFYYSVTDSRGDTTNDFNVFNIDNGYFIEYVKLTCNVSSDQMTAEGNINITVTGKYYQGTLGTTQNSLSLRYSLNKENTEDVWYNLGTVTPTVDSNNNYTYTFTITGLDYLSVYKLSVCAKDKVMAEESVARYTLASTPVFDWSKNDFNFNVPVNMTQGFKYPQTILWTGANQMDSGESITLNEPISEQASGIILIFSLYRNGAAENASIQSFFVPRVQIQYLVSGAPHLFMMGINSNMSVFGSKYLYITDSTIRGFEGNTNSGTAAGSGITFNNSNFVLRYVLGV